MILDNPLIGILFSSLTIAILAGLIHKVVNSHREIDKQIDTAFDEIKITNSVTYPINEMIRATMAYQQMLERTISPPPPSSPAPKKLESKDLTPLSEQLEKLGKK